MRLRVRLAPALIKEGKGNEAHIANSIMSVNSVIRRKKWVALLEIKRHIFLK